MWPTHLHKGSQRLDTLHGHRVVDGGTHAAHTAVALQLHHVQLLGLLDEGLVEEEEDRRAATSSVTE